MNILDKLAQRQQGRQQSAAEEYRQLIQKVVDGKDDDGVVVKLDTLASQLHFNHEQIANDIATVKTIRELLPIIGDIEPATKDLEKANAAAKAFDLKLVQWQNEKLAESRTYQDARRAAGARIQAAELAQKQHDDLKRKFAHLF